MSQHCFISGVVSPLMIRVETPAQLTSYLGVSVCMTVYSVGTCDGMLLLLVTSVLASLLGPALARLSITAATPSGSLFRAGEGMVLECSTNLPWFLCIWDTPRESPFVASLLLPSTCQYFTHKYILPFMTKMVFKRIVRLDCKNEAQKQKVTNFIAN